MWLTGLADHIRGAGLTVSEVDGWQTRGAKGLGMSGVLGAVWHDTETPRSTTRDYPTMSTILNGRSDLPPPLANLGLGYSGTVYVISAGRCNHAGRGSWPGIPTDAANSYCIGIEMESPGRGIWTEAQLRVMPVLRDALGAAYSIPLSHQIAHREWAPARKDDPVGINIRTMTRKELDDMTPDQAAQLARVEAKLDAIASTTATTERRADWMDDYVGKIGQALGLGDGTPYKQGAAQPAFVKAIADLLGADETHVQEAMKELGGV